MGIEPTTAAWEAAVLPLNYIRIIRGRFAREAGSAAATIILPQTRKRSTVSPKIAAKRPDPRADRTPLYPYSVYPCQQGDGGVTGMLAMTGLPRPRWQHESYVFVPT